MANREELAIIRGARSGNAAAQLTLGERYLFGSSGLPRSLPTALHWLDRAARQDCASAWELIGNHVPLELARQSPGPVLQWYERAWRAGVARAGLVYAQLALGPRCPAAPSGADASDVVRALETAAQAGFPEAQWMLAQRQAHAAVAPGAGTAVAPAASAASPWLQRAAESGVAEARFALFEEAWAAQEWPLYLARSLPAARALLEAAHKLGRAAPRLAPAEVTMVSRCARLLSEGVAVDAAGSTGPDEVHRLWELAATEQDAHAQLALGLWWARMGVDGRRDDALAGAANFKKAIRWLEQAGEQGLAQAWFALSRIYMKPEFSQRNIADAQGFLERAAVMGYREAQFECGNLAWRARRDHAGNDVLAVFWLQKAAAQGCDQATAMLDKIAPRCDGPLFTETGALAARRDLSTVQPLLAARLALAALFQLTRAEALLLDIKAADRGHCLVVDIRASYGRSKRRLVQINPVQRQRFDQILSVFGNIDTGPTGPEGNYRQRLYRLRTSIPEAAAELDMAA
ncbi:tetratricopeptide repeat protein [Massilia sp. S19_KUP03_FR1]|uniref:tetratricopeptide repeat protein n=1 Tax=Massilia sp. S19_KUP03_FR1 TaxID=3025503 RepID=UPI002FCDD319